MKIILTEEQLSRILKEEMEGIDSFLDIIVSKFPQMENHKDIIKNFLNKSNCKKVSFGTMNGAAGISTHDGVLFNQSILNMDLSYFLFVIFHEVAHQYQYKKYGEEKMYEFYYDKISTKEAAKLMKDVELIADNLADRKIKECANLGIIKYKDHKIYNTIPLSHFEHMIGTIKQKMKDNNVKSYDDIVRMVYNFVNAKINTPVQPKKPKEEKSNYKEISKKYGYPSLNENY
jgi:hypothetical protein